MFVLSFVMNKDAYVTLLSGSRLRQLAAQRQIKIQWKMTG